MANDNRELENKYREKLNDERESLYLENNKARKEKTAKENMAEEGGTPVNKRRNKTYVTLLSLNTLDFKLEFHFPSTRDRVTCCWGLNTILNPILRGGGTKIS